MAIPILEPQVLRGVVEQLQTPEDLVLLRNTPRTPWAFPAASWDVIRGQRNIATPNVPNSEAHIVGQQGRSAMTAGFVYLREKKVFEPTTIHWIRTPGDAGRVNAEAAVMREVTDLNTRFDNFAERLLWGALSGALNLTYADVQINVDYGLSTSHKITVLTTLASQDSADFIALVQRVKQIISKDGSVKATDVYLDDVALGAVYSLFSGILSDRAKDEYLRSGSVPDLLGLNWHPISSVYEDGGSVTPFVAPNTLIFANLKDNRPLELFEGPTADHDAPTGHTGKFSKSWEDPDPSGRQFLLEWNILPVLTRPDQIATVTFASS